MEEGKSVRPKMKSSQLGKWGDLGSKGVPCNCLRCGQGQRYGIRDRCSDGSGAYYGSSYGNEGRRPSSVYESLGEVRHPESGQDQGIRRGAGDLRCGDWLGAWSSLSRGHTKECLSGQPQFLD